MTKNSKARTVRNRAIKKRSNISEVRISVLKCNISSQFAIAIMAPVNDFLGALWQNQWTLKLLFSGNDPPTKGFSRKDDASDHATLVTAKNEMYI